MKAEEFLPVLDALNKLNITRTITTRLAASEVEDALKTSWGNLSQDEYMGKVSEGCFEVSVPGLSPGRSTIHINGTIQDSADGSIIKMRAFPPLWFIVLVSVILTAYAAYATPEGMRLTSVATIAFFIGVLILVVVICSLLVMRDVTRAVGGQKVSAFHRDIQR